MVVMISSAPGHFEQRRIIRETYASYSNLKGKGIKVVFLMGLTIDGSLNNDVKHEASLSKDINQANYDDTYHNLTLSHFSMFKWAYLNCIGGKNKGVTVPKFIMKADDDFLLNLDVALDVAEQNSEYELIGCLFCNGTVSRDTNLMHKYYTPRYMHIAGTFSGYVSGVAYVMRSDIIPLLFYMTKTTPTIHMDDVYVTGILLQELGIQAINSDLFTYVRNDLKDCKSRQMVSSKVLNPSDMTEQWNMLLEPINCTLDKLEIKLKEMTDAYKDYCFYKY